ncbi:MAG TPA: cystathionine gamma-synthase [Steroidobacteraceae bacterium]|jgi:cystathionine gamma-synthase|nr:cystathionine gamma-synthase [Steroidobacteraceae bacterium]
MTQLTQDTRAVRAGLETCDETGAVVPPIHLSSTYAFRKFGDKRKYDYSRSGNPTRDLLAEALADLEGGAGAVVTGSGMGAITLTGHLLPVGARVVAPHDCYGGTFRLFTAWNKRRELQVDFVDFGNSAALDAALSRPAALVWIETPSNPLLRITDIADVSKRAHGIGALVVADNTFLSPGWQRPLELGADIVVHSTTKYINGHSDVVGGAVIAKTPQLAEQLAWWGNCLGLTGSAFDSFLTLRGLRTLHVRLREHGRNAQAVAEFLANQKQVKRVYYPGLAGHPGHDIARRQQSGFGAIVSVEVAGGIEGARRFSEALELFSLAESLGGVESLVAHPATMTHAAMAPEARAAAGLVDGLLRLSIGIESTDDLLRDLANGVKALG